MARRHDSRQGRWVSDARTLGGLEVHNRENDAVRWIDAIPLSLLLPIALLIALAPFFPEPHLWEKLKMLLAGQLHKPIDVFDLFWHATPLVLVALKLARMWQSREFP